MKLERAFLPAGVWSLMCVLVALGTLPVSGQSTSQQWYDQAQARIDTLRRGTFEIQVLDASGQPHTGTVKVRMKKHEFPFGIAFDFYEGEVTTEIPTETQWLKAAMYEYFNYGASGNSFKWSGIDPNGSGPNYTNFENALKWTEKVGWELRAHTLLWGGAEGDNHAMPQWVTNLGTAQRVFDECEERVTREVARYKGRVREYDVMNEPVHATYTQDRYGDSLNWKSFQWAAAADPDAQLFINEYNVEFSWGDLDEYHALIKDIIDRGAPVSGIGVQAHFWDCCRPNTHDILTCLNTLSEFNVPIKLTEFDFDGTLPESEQAADVIKVYTIAFSHPSVNGVVYWNLADHLSWRENAGMLRADHTPKPAADTLQYLTKTLWATNFEQNLEADGSLAFPAYYGDYVVEVQFGETVKQFSLPLHSANKGERFVLREEEADMKTLEMLSANVRALNQVALTYDQPVDATTLDKYNFRVFTSNQTAIATIQLDPTDSRVVLLNLNKDLSVLDYVTVSYFPGTLAAASGAPAEAVGLKVADINRDLNKEPIVSDYQFELATNAAGGTQVGRVVADDPEGVALTYRIAAGDHLGVFGIGRNTGIITLLNPFYLDFNQNPTYNLTVEVSDGVHKMAVSVVIAPRLTLQVPEQVGGVFPNPTRGQLEVRSASGFHALTLYNMGGQVVHQAQYPDTRQMATLHLSVKPGVYLLKVHQPDGDRETFKVVVE